MATQPDTQQAEAEPNSTIIYPTVPKHEEDPAARVNVMKAMFNNSLQGLKHNDKVNTGFAHEIATAQYLLDNIVCLNDAVQRGCHISRSLITKEKAAGPKGDSQLVKVPIGKQGYRELDMVFFDNRDGAGGILTIVEAKSTKSVDHHHMRPNIQLAKRLGGKLMSSVDRPGQETALQAAYSSIPETQNLPRLEVIVPIDENGRFACQWNDLKGPQISFTRTFTQEDRLRFYRLDQTELYEAVNTEEGTKYVFIGGY
jgi:hypothetical protein